MGMTLSFEAGTGHDITGMSSHDVFCEPFAPEMLWFTKDYESILALLGCPDAPIDRYIRVTMDGVSQLYDHLCSLPAGDDNRDFLLGDVRTYLQVESPAPLFMILEP